MDRVADLLHGLRHTQPRRLKWSALIVIEDATHRRAIVQDHIARRIDLRGATAPVDYRSAVPRAEFDVEAAAHVVRRICDDVRARG